MKFLLTTAIILFLNFGCSENTSSPKRTTERTTTETESSQDISNSNKSEKDRAEKEQSNDATSAEVEKEVKLEPFDSTLLIGAWNNCESGINFLSANSYRSGFVFNEGNSYYFAEQYFSDLNCSTPLTPQETNVLVQDAITYFQSINEPLDEQGIAYHQNLYSTGLQFDGTYEVKGAIESLVWIDITSMTNGISYTTYELMSFTPESIKFAAICTTEDIAQAVCTKEVGTKDDNRPTSVESSALIYQKSL